MGILGELERAGLIHQDVYTLHSPTLGDALEQYDELAISGQNSSNSASGRFVVIIFLIRGIWSGHGNAKDRIKLSTLQILGI